MPNFFLSPRWPAMCQRHNCTIHLPQGSWHSPFGSHHKVQSIFNHPYNVSRIYVCQSALFRSYLTCRDIFVAPKNEVGVWLCIACLYSLFCRLKKIFPFFMNWRPNTFEINTNQAGFSPAMKLCGFWRGSLINHLMFALQPSIMISIEISSVNIVY